MLMKMGFKIILSFGFHRRLKKCGFCPERRVNPIGSRKAGTFEPESRVQVYN
jgi:hypothetical protein